MLAPGARQGLASGLSGSRMRELLGNFRGDYYDSRTRMGVPEECSGGHGLMRGGGPPERNTNPIRCVRNHTKTRRNFVLPLVSVCGC